MMSPAAISALAALGGSSLGALGPVLSNYVLQRSLTRRDLVHREIADRQKLYSDFISEAAHRFADAMTSSALNLNDVVTLYALLSRIRLVATTPVVATADALVKTVVQRYGDENVSLEGLRTAALAATSDPLSAFSTACRKDLQQLLRRSH